jgi:hypothetical protein
VTYRLFLQGPPVSPTNKTDNHDIAEILLKVALNTITITNTKIAELEMEGYSDTEANVTLNSHW